MHLLHGVYPFAFALMRINGRSAMPAPKTLPQNESPLSKAALKWLMKERGTRPAVGVAPSRPGALGPGEQGGGGVAE